MSHADWVKSLTAREHMRWVWAHRLDKFEDRLLDLPFYDNLPGWVWDGQKVLCRVLGHSPISDQCGIPEHDFCAWCGISMPGQGT